MKSKFLTEFKEFAMRGNVVDMAVGIIIGAAFGKIVSSLVGDILMPILGLITGSIDFSALQWVIRKEVVDAAGEVIKFQRTDDTLNIVGMDGICGSRIHCP